MKPTPTRLLTRHSFSLLFHAQLPTKSLALILALFTSLSLMYYTSKPKNQHFEKKNATLTATQQQRTRPTSRTTPTKPQSSSSFSFTILPSFHFNPLCPLQESSRPPTLPCYFFSLQSPPVMVTNLQTSCRINHNKTKIKKKCKQLPCTMNKLPFTMNSTTKLLLLLYLLTTTFYLTSTYSSSSSSSSSTTFSLLKPATSYAALLAVSNPTPASSVYVKVYVYDLPPEYNSGWLADGRCSRHLFAAEVALHRAVTGSQRFRAADPSEADFFLVPVYVSCNFSAVNGFPALGHARGLLESAVQRVAGEMPYWNRSNGADHVFVASHDYGACFRAMEDKAIADGIPSFMRNSIILQTFGVNYPHPCQDVENILIPPYVSPEVAAAAAEESLAGRERDIWAFFRGKMEVHPKNISGHFYSRRVRTEIWNRFGRDRRFYLRRKRFAGYQSEIARSVFCLCPLGWAPWSPRLVESVALGCVPVIIADGIRLPFPDAVPWPAISLTVPERDVRHLDRILDHVAATNLSDIQRNLKDPAVRQALLFHDDIRVGDATWQVVIGLSKKIDRSFRRRVFPRGEIRLDGI